MQGQLFTQDFLLRGIELTPPWQAVTDDTLERFMQALRGIYAELRADSTINEAQTEHLVIERVLVELGWADDYLPQVNLCRCCEIFPRRAEAPMRSRCPLGYSRLATYNF